MLNSAHKLIDPRRPLMAFVVALMGFFLVVSPATASIEGFDFGLDAESLVTGQFDPERIEKALEELAQSDPDEAASRSSSGPAPVRKSNHLPANEFPQPEDSRHNSPRYALLNGPSPFSTSSSGSTSTTPTLSGTPGGMSLALIAPSLPLLSDNSPVERYAAERSLFLPEPPGSELLRPPQV